jgi:DNA replicative helicase MCM subunit Mcm2 (Cdc46/Mcm family)
MICEICANQEICMEYYKIQDLSAKLKVLNQNIIVEVTVKKCLYYREQKEEDEIRKWENELEIIGKPISVRDKMKAIIIELMKMEKKNGCAQINELIQQLQKYEIQPDEARKLINLMIREGTIYETKPECIKKT